MLKSLLKMLVRIFIIFSVCLSGIFIVLFINGWVTSDESPVSDMSQATSVPITEPIQPVYTEEVSVPPIEWQACNDTEVTEPGFECATVNVPLDYADPTGTQLAIAVIRYKAQSERQGVILYNPGGPGASGFDAVAWAGSYYVNELGLDSFDFVGFDPRGVDRSNGLKCQSDADIDRYQFGDASPDTPEEEAFFDEADKAFVDGCKSKFGDTMQFYSTSNTARDMDVIRAAMGEEQISYLGVSYGTYLGAVYANLFPDRVRAMVLDSAFQPNGDTVEEQYMTQLGGFEKAMNNWIAWCESDTTCAFHADDVGARWDALYEQYNQQPVRANDGRMTHQSVILRATESALYAESRWNTLAEALIEAEQGDVNAVWELVDSYNERDENGVYKSSVHAFHIIICASGIEYPDVPDPAGLLQKMQAVAPRMSVDMKIDDFESDDGGCADIMPAQAVAPIRYAGDAPILVIGGENDPATPMRWAEKMRDDMGPNASLLVYSGEGHGQVLSSTCVTNAAAKTLIDRELPADGTRCDPDAAIEEPSWWANVPRPKDGEQLLNRVQVEEAIGITKSDAYASGLVVSGTTDEIMDDMHQRLELSGFWAAGDGDTLDNDVQLRDYVIEGTTIRLLVIGSELIARDEWVFLQDDVPAQHGMVFFLAFP